MDGIIIINKNKGYTSHDIVYKVKKIFKQKVGHTGTLDPMATGVLPLLVGKATLCSKYLINHDKIYKVQLQLGIKTDTLDSEGKVVEKQEVDKKLLEEKNINKTLQTFLGKQQQIPPMYSAIKVNGKKLYEYARKGQKIEVKPRQIEIYKINLEKIDKENKIIEFEVNCSKGTYIRSLCEDIAYKLGTIGHMSKLQRVKVGEFSLLNSITIEQLEENYKDDKWIEKNIITIEQLFKQNNEISLTNKQINLFLNGVKLNFKKNNGLYKIYNNEKFIGTGILQDNLLKRDIIL